MKPTWSAFAVLTTICIFSLSTAAEASVRIVGGTPVTIEEIPYQLSVELYETHICGASIISDIWALTAAHCALRANNDTSVIRLRSGTSYFGRDGTLHSIALIVIHPQFDDYDYYQDVAALRLTPSDAFVTGPTAMAVPLADVAPPLGTVCTLSGWGRTHSEYPVIPEQLHKVDLPVIDLDRCDLMYQAFDGVSNTSLCAGPEEGGRDACEGDFGGPLTSGGSLVGIASWGKGCGQRGYPGVYLSVALVRQWIRDTTGV